jgi:SNF2 family DNA or RNA helicase
MIRKQMVIDFDTKRELFLIECDFYDNKSLLNLPGRSFDRKTRKWKVEPYRKNKEYIRKALTLKAKVTETAQFELDTVKEIQDCSHLKFPISYQHKLQPYDHQKDALDFIYGLDSAALFMEMGTGKTKVSIDIFSCYRQEEILDKFLIICPFAVRDNWIEELKVHIPIPYEKEIIDTKSKAQIRRVNDLIKTPIKQTKVLIVGTESLSQAEINGRKQWIKGKGKAFQLIENFLSSGNPGIIVDESHLIKGFKAMRSKNVVYLGTYAKKKLILTGTPIANNPMDLYMQYEFLDPEIIGIGNFYAYKERYAILGGFENRQVVGFQNMDELTKTLGKWTYQCKKADVLDLPAKVHQVRKIKLSKKQLEYYKKVKEDRELIVSQSAGNIELVVENTLVMYTALQQISSGFIMLRDEDTRKKEIIEIITWDKNPKIKELDNILPSIEGKIIIWAKYHFEFHHLEQFLIEQYGKESYTMFHGLVPEKDRSLNISKWKTNSECRFLLTNQQMGGVGNTWNEANTSIYYSNTFKYIDRIQSEDRNHRIGQNDHVLYIDIVAENTVEQQILNSIKMKKDVADYVLDCIDKYGIGANVPMMI